MKTNKNSNTIINCSDCNGGGNIADCCNGKIECNMPQCLHQMHPACIFVEKVFDARLFKKEREVDVNDLIVSITPDLDAVDTVNVQCELISLSTEIVQLFVDDQEVTPLVTIPGPGGDQTLVPQTYVDSTRCDLEGKGTTISMRQRVEVTYTVELTVTGTGTKGIIPLDYTGTATITDGTFTFSVLIDDFCFPPTSQYPISVLDACLANCIFDLISFTFDAANDELTLNGVLIFCLFCEKKIKVPVEICVLTTGPCKIPENRGYCDSLSFPEVFQPAMHREADDYDCGCSKEQLLAEEEE